MKRSNCASGSRIGPFVLDQRFCHVASTGERLGEAVPRAMPR